MSHTHTYTHSRVIERWDDDSISCEYRFVCLFFLSLLTGARFQHYLWLEQNWNLKWKYIQLNESFEVVDILINQTGIGQRFNKREYFSPAWQPQPYSPPLTSCFSSSIRQSRTTVALFLTSDPRNQLGVNWWLTALLTCVDVGLYTAHWALDLAHVSGIHIVSK